MGRPRQPTTRFGGSDDASDGVPRAVQGPGRGEGHPARSSIPNDAIVRVTLAAICGSDLHLYHGMMPDTRVGHDLRPRVHRRGRARSGSSVQNLKVGDRVMVPFNIFCGSLLLLRPRAVLQLPQRQPERHRGRRHLRLLAHLRRLRRRPGRVRAGAVRRRRARRCIPDWMDDEDAVLLTDALPDRLLRRAARRHRRGRHRGGLRRRPGGPVRREVGVADGRRPGDRHRPPRVPAGEGAHVRARRDVQLHRVRRHRRAHEEDHRLPRRRRGHRRGRRRGRRQPPAARHRARSSSCRAARRSR